MEHNQDRQDALDPTATGARHDTPSFGATEDEVDRTHITPDVTDMGLDALGRDEPHAPGYGRGEPSAPGSASPQNGGGIENDSGNFHQRGRDMQSPPDPGASREAGGPGYNSAGAQGDGAGGMFPTPGQAAGAGPLGGAPGRGDTPGATAARRAYGIPAPSAPTANGETLGVNNRSGALDADPKTASTASSAPTDEDLERVERQRGAIYGDTLGGAGGTGNSSGSSGALLQQANQDAPGYVASNTDQGYPQSDTAEGGDAGYVETQGVDTDIGRDLPQEAEARAEGEALADATRDREQRDDSASGAGLESELP